MRKPPQVGMVGFVVGCLSPNHASATTSASESHNILLVKIDEDLCVPISEKGVKEYKTITSPPSTRHLSNAPKNTTVDEKDEESEEQESKDEHVTL